MTKHESVWVDTASAAPPRPRLEGDVEADVVVIGGGIVGVTTALLLREAGASVVLLEATRIGLGVTGYTTAKVSSQHGFVYARTRSKHGADAARAYGEANEAALDWIAHRVSRDGIDCDFRRRPSYAYLSAGSSRAEAEREAEAAAEAGLPATLVDDTPLPYPVAAAVRFDDQAEFHALDYLNGLARQIPDGVYEETRATGLDGGRRSVVETTGGRVTAEQVVVATGYPILDRSFAFARVHAERSYALLCRIAGEPPPGMFISADSPTRSVRAVPVAGEELLMVGGEGHRTGEGGDTERRYETLEAFAREHWDVRSVDYRWSSQDNFTIDGLPYAGPVNPLSKRILMATGFAKWGLTNGTAAAMVLTDLILGRENPWAALFNPNRLKPRAAAPKLVEDGARVGLHLAGDWIRDRGAPTCTHMGCKLKWNSAEASWDCPCHGSRFAEDGSVLQGPAVRPLKLED